MDWLNSTKPLVSISLLFVAILAAVFFYFDSKLSQTESLYKKALEDNREDKEAAIDSITEALDRAYSRLDDLRQEKADAEKSLSTVKKKLIDYEKPRYFPDATFSTESNRIATSRYRHNKPDGSTGQGEGN